MSTQVSIPPHVSEGYDWGVCRESMLITPHVLELPIEDDTNSVKKCISRANKGKVVEAGPKRIEKDNPKPRKKASYDPNAPF